MKWLPIAVLLTVFALPAVTVDAKNQRQKSDVNETDMALANLVDYKLQNGYMRIKVLTAGCTGVTSFKVVADSSSENSLKVLRVKPDECGMKLRPIELQYSIRHLGLDINQTINIVNIN